MFRIICHGYFFPAAVAAVFYALENVVAIRVLPHLVFAPFAEGGNIICFAAAL